MSESDPKKQLSKGEGGCAGFILFVVSVAICVPLQSLRGLYLGCALALLALCFRYTRSVFIGFILSALIITGLTYLVIIISCYALNIPPYKG
jgi:hypothetical protein